MTADDQSNTALITPQETGEISAQTTGIVHQGRRCPEDLTEMLLARGSNQARPALENRVAYQWEQEGDVLGHYNGSKKNRLTLQWLGDAVRDRTQKVAVLDVGCAYGNMLLMLNAKLGKPADVKLVGVDLHPEGMQFARTFTQYVPGYANCTFEVADLTRRLPFDDSSFDAVNLGDVLEHMDRPAEAVQELIRITKPGGVILISTPLRDSLFKRIAAAVNRLSGGRLHRSYYKGKDAQLDDAGRPIMNNPVGNDHVSEMTLEELQACLTSQGLKIEKTEMMPVMSGSKWFDRHLFLLSILTFIEALHSVFQFKSWAHSAILLARVPQKSKV